MTDNKTHSGPQNPAENYQKNDQSKQQQQQTDHKSVSDKGKQRIANEGYKPQQK